MLFIFDVLHDIVYCVHNILTINICDVGEGHNNYYH